MRILVCGGRDYRDSRTVWNTLSNVLFTRWPYGGWPEPKWFTIIGGEAKGADTLGKQFAEDMGCQYLGFKPDWETYGKSAGFRRNTDMLVEGKPDLVVAFPGGVGTAMMVRISKEAGVEVIEVK